MLNQGEVNWELDLCSHDTPSYSSPCVFTTILKQPPFYRWRNWVPVRMPDCLHFTQLRWPGLTSGLKPKHPDLTPSPSHHTLAITNSGHLLCWIIFLKAVPRSNWFKSLQRSQQAITFACDRRLSASNTGHSLGRLVQITFYYIGPLECPKLHILLILMEFQLRH